MERHEIPELMGELSLVGMRHAYDGVRRGQKFARAGGRLGYPSRQQRKRSIGLVNDEVVTPGRRVARSRP